MKFPSQYLIFLLPFWILASPALADPAPADPGSDPSTILREYKPLPLVNRDFASPAVPGDQKWVDNARADGWTYDIQGGGVGLGVEFWTKDRSPLFFWNDPNGSIAQTIDPGTFTIPKAGEVYKLSYFYGMQGQRGAAYTLTATILADGIPVATENHAVLAPLVAGNLAGILTYPARPDDVGKSLGVSFAFAKNGDETVQAVLKDVALTVSPAASP